MRTMYTYTIKHRAVGSVLYETRAASLRDAVVKAVRNGTPLRYADLPGVDLSELSLRGADFTGAKLDRAMLQHTNLSGALLSSCSMRHVNATSASFEGAAMHAVDMTGATICGAALSGASLAGARLKDVRLSGADLQGAHLSATSFERAHIVTEDGVRLTLIGARPVLCLGPLGSRNDYLTAYVTDHGTYVMAGCFFGPLVDFVQAVHDTHKNTVHNREYAQAVKLIQQHAIEWAAQ